MASRGARSAYSSYDSASARGFDLLLLPEDLVGVVLAFVGPAELATIGASCRELYFATFAVASHAFRRAFGAPPDSSLTRGKLYHALERIKNKDDASCRDLFVWSCMRGYAKMVKALTVRAANVPQLLESRYGPSGATPLLLAVEHNRPVVVKLLLELGADASRASARGMLPAHIAARFGYLPLLKLLQAAGADVGRAASSDGRTALHFAAAAGQVGAVAWLLEEASADPDAVTVLHDDIGTEAAIHVASYFGHAPVVARLLRAGANPNATLRNGRTPALIAAEMGWHDVLHTLVTCSVQYPVDLSVCTDSGKSPLYCAVERACAGAGEGGGGGEATVKLLLQAGADAAQATRRSKIPLAAAAEKGALPVAKVLLDHEAAAHAAMHLPLSRSSFSGVALGLAQRTNNKAMRDLLLAYTLSERGRARALLGLGYEVEEGEDGEEGEEEAPPSPTPGVRAYERPEGLTSGAYHAAHNPLAGVFGSNAAALSGTGASAFVAALARQAAHRGGGGGGEADAPPAPVVMGRTLAESMIAMRATREREAAEAAVRGAEMERAHRAKATEMAASARRRKEEKAVEEAAAAAQNAVVAREKADREANARIERERSLLAGFLTRSAAGKEAGPPPLPVSLSGAGIGGPSRAAITASAATVVALSLGPAVREAPPSSAPPPPVKQPLSPYAEKLTAAARKAAKHGRGSPGKGPAVRAIDLGGEGARAPDPRASAGSQPSLVSSADSISIGGEGDAGKPAAAAAKEAPPPPAAKSLQGLLARVNSGATLLARVNSGALARAESSPALVAARADEPPSSPRMAPAGNVIGAGRAAPPERVAMTLKSASFAF